MLTLLAICLLSQSPGNAPRAVSLMSRYELQDEIDLLEEARPRPTRPLAFMAAGGGLIGAEMVYAFFASDNSFGRDRDHPYCGSWGLICAADRNFHPAEVAIVGVGAAM